MSKDDSFILQKREDLELTLRTQNADALSRFLDQPATYIAETVTGALAEGMKGVAASAGRLVQGALKVQLLTQVAREIRYFQEKGKIKEDDAKDKYGFQTWVELLSVIDSEAADEDRLKAIKAMFLAVNKPNVTDGEKIANYQLFQLVKKIRSGQLLVLETAYRVRTDTRYGPAGSAINASTWLTHIATELGHGLISLIEYEEQGLMQLQLITPRLTPGRPYDTVGSNARLTDLGLHLCENISNYEIARKDMP